MLEINVTVLVLLFGVLIVVVNMLCTLVIAVLADYIKR
jgi:MFS-type transporter involved in bile tolerance (Atg22 family)